MSQEITFERAGRFTINDLHINGVIFQEGEATWHALEIMRGGVKITVPTSIIQVALTECFKQRTPTT